MSDVSKAEMRERIDLVVNGLGDLLTESAQIQREKLIEFRGMMNALGFDEVYKLFGDILNLSPTDRVKVISEMRGVMLKIRDEQYGGED